MSGPKKSHITPSETHKTNEQAHLSSCIVIGSDSSQGIMGLKTVLTPVYEHW
jgi:hypothetical protein